MQKINTKSGSQVDGRHGDVQVWQRQAGPRFTRHSESRKVKWLAAQTDHIVQYPLEILRTKTNTNTNKVVLLLTQSCVDNATNISSIVLQNIYLHFAWQQCIESVQNRACKMYIVKSQQS